MNLFKITLYSVLKEHFFDLLYNINCDARYYVGCTNVKKYFDIERVEREELIEIGLRVKVSRPVVVRRELIGGDGIASSLSYKGVLVICCRASGFKCQLTDLVTGRQVNFGLENITQTGFYDDSMVMLSWNCPLRVCSVEDMFLNGNASVLRSVGDMKVGTLADISLLHSTRVLLFTSMMFIPHEYNVDTGVIRAIGTEKKVFAFASLTGIDVGVKGVFMEYGNNYPTHSLNKDNSTSLVQIYNPSYALNTFIPSSSNPRDIRKGMKIYGDGSFVIDTTDGAELTTPFKFRDGESIVRLYQDIFLVYDGDTNKWCLVKIIVP